MKKNSLIIVCPGGKTTGGIELLHQLVDALNQFGANAWILYYPFSREFEKMEVYEKYKVPLISYSKALKPDNAIILPEVFTYLIPKFPTSKVYLWWMSVDNYINSRKLRFAIGNKFFPWDYLDISRLSSSISRISGHFYQSEYARSYLESYNLKNLYPLSDYINLEYSDDMDNIDYASKRNIIIYNPAKGIKQTESIKALLDECEFIPIVNMNRYQVKELLKLGKIYIDFGNHPGKDRIPREAAAMGCCIIVNRKGSAQNLVDINIPQEFKVDDMADGFEFKVASLIRKILKSYETEIGNFDKYRSIIRMEKEVFNASVMNLINEANT